MGPQWERAAVRRTLAVCEALESRTLLSAQALNAASTHSPLTVFRNHIYFTGSDADHGTELWRSNGSRSGTALFKELTPGPSGTAISSFFEHGNALYVSTGSTQRQQLWRTDGTVAGTQLVFQANAPKTSRPAQFTSVGDLLYFVAPTAKGVLWRISSKDPAAVRVAPTKLINHQLESLTAFKGALFFVGMVPRPQPGTPDGFEPILYRSDGTGKGTRAVHQFDYVMSRSDSYPGWSPPTNLAAVGDRLYFKVLNSDQYFGYETDPTPGLWKSAGTPGTTQPIGFTSRSDGTPQPFPVGGTWSLNGRLILGRAGGLYVSDGTLAGTRPLYQADNTRFREAEWDRVVVRDGLLYFPTEPGSSNWHVTDGTRKGTRVVEKPPAHLSGKVELKGFRYGIGMVQGKPPMSLLKFDSSRGDITGQVRNDRDRDGKNDGDPYMSGATVFIDLDRDGQRDPGEPFSRTTSSGVYRFSYLKAGAYQLVVEGPTDTWIATSASPRKVKVVGDQLARADFYMIDDAPTAQIAGTVFRDFNGDGEPSNGEGYPGFRLYLDLNDNKRHDANEPWTRSDANGRYEFTSLRGGYYRTVRITSVEGWDTAVTDEYHQTPFLQPHKTNTVNFRVARKRLLTGIVFDDQNADGIRQAHEPPLPGLTAYVSVSIPDGNGTRHDSTATLVTDAAGAYQHVFAFELADVHASFGSGRRSTLSNDASRVIGGNAESVTVDLPATALAKINGTFALGAERRWSYPDPPVPLPGWQVYVDLDGDANLDEDEPVQDLEDGSFSFVLPSGTHQVRAIPAESDHGLVTDALQSVELRDGVILPVRFGVARYWSFTGTAFQDNNGDQEFHYDPLYGLGESAIPGIAVTISSPDSPSVPLATSVTDANGVYQFSGLLLDKYVLRFPAGTSWRPVGGEKYVFRRSGTTVTRDLPGMQQISIVVRVFVDSNDNGIDDDRAGSKLRLGTVWLDSDGDGLIDWNEDEQPFEVLDATHVYFGPYVPQRFVIRISAPGAKITTPSSKLYTLTAADDAPDIHLSFGLHYMS